MNKIVTILNFVKIKFKRQPKFKKLYWVVDYKRRKVNAILDIILHVPMALIMDIGM